MNEPGKKVLLIASAIIFTIAVYVGSVCLILAFGDPPFPMIFLVSVIVLDLIYICTIKFWPLKNLHFKIIVALLLLACSAAIVTVCLMPLNFGF